MNKNVCGKLFTFTVIMLFLGFSVLPAINSQGNNDDVKRIFDKIRELSKQNILDNTSDYDLVIISPKDFVKTLKPLVCHKKSMGVTTKLVTLREVYDSMFWHGRDCSEKVKYFIKESIEQWGIKYVLLVGGMKNQGYSWHVPVRYVHMDDGWEDRYISDLYYADIYDENGSFSSWDSDGDGIYGEWSPDELPDDENIDLLPDVAVGRLPARNTFEVKTMVNKIIKYETSAYGAEWFNDMVVIAGDTYPEHQNKNWTGYEGEYYADLALENMTGFKPRKVYTSDGSLTGPSDVINAITPGCGFLYFVGHGNPRTWGNHPPDDEEFIDGLRLKHMPRLRNKDMLPVCVVSGCHNSQFDVTLKNIILGIREDGLHYFSTGREGMGKFWLSEWVPYCWSWGITKKIGGGSIATIGCTALGYTKEDKVSFNGGLNEIEVEFFKYYGQENISIIGDTWAAAVNSYLDSYQVDWNSTGGSDSFIDTKVVQSWILFGDPSLMIGGYPTTDID